MKLTKAFFFLLTFVSIFAVQEVKGQEDLVTLENIGQKQAIENVTNRIDLLANRLTNEFIRLEDEIRQLYESQKKNREVANALPEVQMGLEAIQATNEEIASVQAGIGEFQNARQELTSSIESALTAARYAERTAVNTRNIIAAIGITVSALGTIIALMFSNRFSDLKADTKVAKKLLARIEGERLTKVEIVAVISEVIDAQLKKKA